MAPFDSYKIFDWFLNFSGMYKESLLKTEKYSAVNFRASLSQNNSARLPQSVPN